MKNKYFKKRDYYQILYVLSLIIIISSTVWRYMYTFGDRADYIIISSCFLIVMLAMTIEKSYKQKDRKFRDKIHDIQFENKYRGEILDTTFGDHISRNFREGDWAYTKRIFAIIYCVNPEGALTILFGKPLTELDELSKWLVENFLTSRQGKKDVDVLLNSFGENDPAKKLIITKGEIGEIKTR